MHQLSNTFSMYSYYCSKETVEIRTMDCTLADYVIAFNISLILFDWVEHHKWCWARKWRTKNNVYKMSRFTEVLFFKKQTRLKTQLHIIAWHWGRTDTVLGMTDEKILFLQIVYRNIQDMMRKLKLNSQHLVICPRRIYRNI